MSIVWENPPSKKEGEEEETQEFTTNPILNQKIKLVCSGLQGTIKRLFNRFPTDDDREAVADFIQASLRQENIAINTKKVYIIGLSYLSKHFHYSKSLKDMTEKDIADYLGSLHRDQNVDPDRKWINTHNTYASVIFKFYKWLAYPTLSPHQRKTLPGDKLPQVLRQLHFVDNKMTG